MKSPKQQTLHTRREFLRTSVLGGALASTVPLFLEKTFLCLDTMAAATPGQIATGKDSTILVVLPRFICPRRTFSPSTIMQDFILNSPE